MLPVVREHGRRLRSWGERQRSNGSLGYLIAISGLWGLKVGNSSFGGSSSVIFSAGPAGYANGRVGIINPAG